MAMSTYDYNGRKLIFQFFAGNIVTQIVSKIFFYYILN